jgi:hypothetical protein
VYTHQKSRFQHSATTGIPSRACPAKRTHALDTLNGYQRLSSAQLGAQRSTAPPQPAGSPRPIAHTAQQRPQRRSKKTARHPTPLSLHPRAAYPTWCSQTTAPRRTGAPRPRSSERIYNTMFYSFLESMYNSSLRVGHSFSLHLTRAHLGLAVDRGQQVRRPRRRLALGRHLRRQDPRLRARARVRLIRQALRSGGSFDKQRWITVQLGHVTFAKQMGRCASTSGPPCGSRSSKGWHPGIRVMLAWADGSCMESTEERAADSDVW